MSKVAKFRMPDGRVARFRVPKDTTPEQATELFDEYVRNNPEQFAPIEPKEPAQPRSAEKQQETAQAIERAQKQFEEDNSRGVGYWARNLGGAVRDVGRVAGSSATLGLSDRLIGAVTGEGHEAAKQRTRQISGELGNYAVPVEVLSSMLLPGGMAKAGLTLSRFGQGISGIGGVGARGALSGLEGGLYAGASSLGNNEGDLASEILKGGSAGAFIPMGLAGIGRAITPVRNVLSKANPQNKIYQDTLEKHGIDLTAGQKTGSEYVKTLEGRSGKIFTRQEKQYTEALMREAGATGRQLATSTNLKNLEKNLGKQYDDLYSQFNVLQDRQLSSQLRQIYEDAITFGPEVKNAIERIVGRDILDVFKASKKYTMSGAVKVPEISGKVVQSVQQRLRDLGDTAGPGNTLGNLVANIRTAFNDAMTRSNPSLMPIKQALDTKYATFKKITQVKGKENGVITPKKMENVLTRGERNQQNYSTGSGLEINRLTDAANNVLTKTKNKLPAFVNRGVGAAIGSTVGGPIGAVIGTYAPNMSSNFMGATSRSRLGQAYLGNRLLGTPSEARDTVANVLSRGYSSYIGGR